MKGREFFSKAYSNGYTPWSEMKRVDEVEGEFIDYIRRIRETVITGNALDIGCGEGRISRLLARKGFDVLGVDYVKAPLVKAVESFRGKSDRSRGACAFILGDVLQWPFLAGSFDIAVDNGCLHHIIKRDWRRYIAGLLRVTKPDSFLILTVFSDRDGHAKGRKGNWIYHRGHYDHFFTTSEVREIFGRWFTFVSITQSTDGELAFHHLLLRRRHIAA
ncbi:MAG: class I SAM-dependent methyltransferase [Thermodesulfobacteriota bacterium]